MVSILILTKNEEKDLPECLKSVTWSNDVWVFDSFSTDKTIEISKLAGANIIQRNFDNWSSHQNWGLSNIPFKNPWVLYIDADERVSLSLYNSIMELDFSNTDVVAFEIQRRDYAWDGKWLKYSQISPFYLRLFQPDKMKYERLVNPKAIPNGKISRIEGYIDHYPFSKGFKHWITRHISYAELEAETRRINIADKKSFSVVKALFNSDLTEKRFHQKGLFYKLPFRPLIKWFYMVIVRKGFLDGKTGITYAFLQAFYEFMIVIISKEKNKL